MRLRDVTICLVCILLAAVLLIAAASQLDYINSRRYQMKLISNQPLENAPPSLAFATVAMGAFRGLVVDVLWLRADRLKQDGQFFDAKQLAEWITILQPRFAKVWEFHAWNMSYNISVAIPETEPDQRWRWVKNGYELLRDRGIPLNPKSLVLYRELARIFKHKIGSVSDSAHKYYKLQLAMAMKPLIDPVDAHVVLGSVPQQPSRQHFRDLAKAPSDWHQVIQDANVVSLISLLKASDKIFAEAKPAEFTGLYLSLRQNPDRYDPNAFRVIDDFRTTKALKNFDVFAKAYQLRNVWKLDPVMMQQINETYGPVDWTDPNRHLPLDWRHPVTHALYWAVKGLKEAGRDPNAGFSINEVNTDRFVGHCLQDLFRNGKIFIYKYQTPEPQQEQQQWQVAAKSSDKLYCADNICYDIYLRQDLRMFESYNKSLMATLQKYKDIEEPTYLTLQNGHRNMLKNALLSFYQAGHLSQAQKIYKQLRELYPRDEFKVPLIVFAKNRLHEELAKLGLNDAKENVQMLLRESYFRYAVRDDDQAFGRESMAREVYDFYQTRHSDEDRINLPDFKSLRYFALFDFLNDKLYPIELRQSLAVRIKVERPDLAKQLEREESKLMQQPQEQR